MSYSICPKSGEMCANTPDWCESNDACMYKDKGNECPLLGADFIDRIMDMRCDTRYEAKPIRQSKPLGNLSIGSYRFKSKKR